MKVIENCWSRTAISFSGQRSGDPDKKMGKRDKNFFGPGCGPIRLINRSLVDVFQVRFDARELRDRRRSVETNEMRSGSI